MFTAVGHEVRTGFGYPYPLNAGLYFQLLHRSSGVGDVIGTVSLRRHPGQINTGRGNVQSGLAVPPFTEAKLYPSTDWEETFPSALSLTAQCHNYTSVFTPWTEGKAALRGPHRRLQSCRVVPLSLSADGRC